MHTLQAALSVCVAFAIIYCKISDGMPELIFETNNCNFGGKELLNGAAITLNETCVKVSCHRGRIEREECEKIELNDPFCGSTNGTGIHFPDCCPVYYCEHGASNQN
uniref:Single domain-containing protein n=1 Tax=Amblyomma triste TaxID=251400 RepID=A0A023G852_AMBTT